MPSKRSEKITAVFLTLLTCAILLSTVGCDGANRPGVPDIGVIGNVIFWNETEDAESYIVYCNGEVVEETTNTYYIAEDLPANSRFTVAAKGAERKSKKSEPVTVYKNNNFTAEETMEITLEDDMGYTVPSDIKFVKIGGSGSRVFVEIASRYTDIIIELENAELRASGGRDGICVAEGGNDGATFGAVINVKGENRIYGGDYVNEQTYVPETNSGKQGVKGGDGGSAISLPNVVFTGTGNLILQGGTGGIGGTGAASSGMSSAVYGNGGDGGDGGHGVECENMIMAMEIGGYVRAFGSVGGNGGMPGDNGSILTGPFNTAQWDDRWGAKGAVGLPLSGNKKVCGGTFIAD